MRAVGEVLAVVTIAILVFAAVAFAAGEPPKDYSGAAFLGMILAVIVVAIGVYSYGYDRHAKGKQKWRNKSLGPLAIFLLLCLTPFTFGIAETITLSLPTTYEDGTAIDNATKAKIGIYFRGWREGNTAAKTYFGELRNGATSWTDNVMVRMNYWAAQESVLGWVPIKPGDNVLITASAFYAYTDNTGATKQVESKETAPYRWTIKLPAPPPWQPPPACSAPTGLAIKD